MCYVRASWLDKAGSFDYVLVSVIALVPTSDQSKILLCVLITFFIPPPTHTGPLPLPLRRLRLALHQGGGRLLPRVRHAVRQGPQRHARVDHVVGRGGQGGGAGHGGAPG